MPEHTAVFGVPMPISAVVTMFLKKYNRYTALGFNSMPGVVLKTYKLGITIGGYEPKTEEP